MSKTKVFKARKKCRYNNRGYCKYWEKCKFQHFTQICDQFLKDGKCEGLSGCQLRHPTVWKYWKNEKFGCKRDKACQYMHQNNPSIKATRNKDCKVDTTNTECVDIQNEVMDSTNENDVENTDAVLKIGELEAVISSKDITIKELKEAEVNLKMESQTFSRTSSNSNCACAMSRSCSFACAI